MVGKRNPKTASTLDTQDHPDQTTIYQIRIAGHLDQQWVEWFEDLTLSWEENGDTLLTGPVVDQAALFGLLKKIRDLGISLLSVVRLDINSADASEDGSR